MQTSEIMIRLATADFDALAEQLRFMCGLPTEPCIQCYAKRDGKDIQANWVILDIFITEKEDVQVSELEAAIKNSPIFYDLLTFRGLNGEVSTVEVRFIAMEAQEISVLDLLYASNCVENAVKLPRINKLPTRSLLC